MSQSFRSYHPIDPILSGLLVDATPELDSKLIVPQIFETVVAPTKSFTVLVENKRNFNGGQQAGIDAKRAAGAKRATLNGFDRTNLTSSVDSYSFQDSIPMEEIRDSLFPGSEEQRMTIKVNMALKIVREQLGAELLFTASNWATSTLAALGGGSNGTTWTSAGAEPLTDLHVLYDAVKTNASGRSPDSLILSYKAVRALARNPEIRGIFFATSGATAGERVLPNGAVIDVLKAHLGIPNIYVGESQIETAVSGLSSSQSQIWAADKVWMGCLKGSNPIQQIAGVKVVPTAALHFELGGANGLPTAGSYDEMDMTKRYVWGEFVSKYQIIDNSLGYCMTSCV